MSLEHTNDNANQQSNTEGNHPAKGKRDKPEGIKIAQRQKANDLMNYSGYRRNDKRN